MSKEKYQNSEHDKNNENKGYFISIQGELFETTFEVYSTYKSMKRRELNSSVKRKLHEVSYEYLEEIEYPIHNNLINISRDLEEEIVTQSLIEHMLSVIPQLKESEKWILDELFFKGKSEVELSKESGIPRTTIQSRKYATLHKIRKLMEEPRKNEPRKRTRNDFK